MVTKTCKQCGEIKPIDQYRQYYGGRKGTYTVCKACERINSRAKYLEKKGLNATVAEVDELQKIYKLYDAQRACGLQPPRRESGRQNTLVDDLDSMIANYTEQANSIAAVTGHLDTESLPPDLKNWLTAELTDEPDYYLDEVYEDLKAKYRPIQRIDGSTMLPVYDDTYKAALEAVLDRFNKYEDEYYSN